MIFEAENLGQKNNHSMCPIACFASKIRQPEVTLLKPGEFNAKRYMNRHPSQVISREIYEDIDPIFLFGIKLDDPKVLLDIETSHLIADTIGPQLYFDVYQNYLLE